MNEKDSVFNTREDVKRTLEEGERFLQQRAAEMKLREDKKYALMLSRQTMLIVSIVGLLIVFFLIGNGFHEMKFMNDRAAYLDWGFAAFFVITATAWIARSLVLQKQYQRDLEYYVASGKAKKDFERGSVMKVKKEEEVFVHYKIETFERLSEEEMEKAEEEWDEYLLQCTDRFYRMNVMFQPLGQELYQVFVELRYPQLGDVNVSLLSEVDDFTYDRMKELDAQGFTEPSDAFKDGVKAIVRKSLAEVLPDFRVYEICVAVRKVS